MSRRLFALCVLSLAALACPSRPGPPGDAAARDAAAKAPPGAKADVPSDGAVWADAVTTREALVQRVQKGTTDPKDPWSMAHGLVAFGPSLKAADGRRAVDILLSDYATKDKDRYRFPKKTAGGDPVDAHPNLMMKALLEAGVQEATLTPKRRAAWRGLLTALRQSERPGPTEDAAWRQYAWTQTAWLLAAPPPPPEAVHTLAANALDQLEREHGFLLALMDANAPERVVKKKQGIFAHTCGGLHFFQAVARAIAQTEAPDLRRRLQRQWDVLWFRYTAERRIYARYIESQPRYRIILLIQELKFYGHVLETVGLGLEWGLLRPTTELRRKVEPVLRDLTRVVQALTPAYAAQDRLRESAPQSYFDLIGDGCHAIRGLRLIGTHLAPPPAPKP